VEDGVLTMCSLDAYRLSYVFCTADTPCRGLRFPD
jgi:hypothetical protein